MSPPPRRLGAMTWPELADSAGRSLLAVPLGATEQHGPHLPLGTDTMIATALAERLAAARSDVIVAPGVPYGSSGEHAAFAGTLSIGGPVTELLLVELVRSADAFAGVVLVSGHGGNAPSLDGAVTLLRSEGRRVLGWEPRLSDGDAHAGRTETSLLLALQPSAVRQDQAERGNPAPLVEMLPTMRAGGVAAVSANGVLGDPEGATAEEGTRLLAAMAADLAAAVQAWLT
ncbi:MAG: mycofactocin biosynthesis peptidyl-dipeptidase MftE [Acidimicrobiales bacterium]